MGAHWGGGGGLIAFYWYQVFAIGSADVEAISEKKKMFDCIIDLSQYLLRLYPNILSNISPVIFSDASVDRASTPSTDLNIVLGQKNKHLQSFPRR